MTNLYHFWLGKTVVDVDKDPLEALAGSREIVLNILEKQLSVDDEDMVLANAQQV